MPGLLAANSLITHLLVDFQPLAAAYGMMKDVILAALTLRLVISGRWRSLPGPLVWFTLAFLAIGVIGMLWSTSPSVAAYGFRNDFYPALWVAVACELFVEERVRSSFARFTAATAMVSAMLLMVTWSRGVEWLLFLRILPQAKGDPFPSSYFNSGVVDPRGFSPWEGPNIAGVVLVMMLAIVVLVLPARPWFRLLVVVPLLPAIWLTGSRSSLLGLVGVVGLLSVRLVWLKWGTRGMVACVLAALATSSLGVWLYFFQSGRMADDPSLVGHSESLVQGVEMVAAHPWGVGVGDAGPRSVGISEQAILLESSWFLLAVEASLLATIAFVLLQGYPLARCLSMPRTPHAYVAPAVIAGSLVSQLVLPTIQEGSFSHLFWMAVGLGLAATRGGPVGGSGSAHDSTDEDRVALDAPI